MRPPSIFSRLWAWYCRLVDRMPNFTTHPAMRSYQRLSAMMEGAPDYRALVKAAAQSGARTTARKRKGNIVVIIDLPQKGGTTARLRLKFKEKP